MKLYFIDGKVIAQNGNVKIYEFNNSQYLDINKVLWMRSEEYEEISKQIGNKAKGKCLEIGLGLGIASEYMLSNGAEHLTTIEINPDVIAVYKQLNKVDYRHRIIQGSGKDFLIVTEECFDFIFMDFYSLIDEDTLKEIEIYMNLIVSKKIIKTGGEVVAWFDPYTPEKDAETFKRYFIERGFELCKT